MISQPRIAVLGLSQPYAIYRTCLQILVVVVLGFELYLQFKLRFKPSAYLYLRTSSKTKDRHLGLLHSLRQSLLVSISSSLIRLPRGLVSVHYYKGSQVSSCLALVSEVSLCLVGQVTLRSSTFVSSIESLAKSHASFHVPHCLSQANGCSDRYTREESPDRIVHGLRCKERIRKGNEAVQCVCVSDVVRS